MNVRFTKVVLTAVFYCFAVSLFAQSDQKDRGKRYYTREEVRAMCGVPVDTEEMKDVLARQKEMYADYLKSKQGKPLGKATAIPDWRGDWMSEVENQGSCGNCWAHAATGVTDGLLHKYYGTNIEIDLDEIFLKDHAPGYGCEGGWPSDALDYIKNYKVPAESGYSTFPNKPGSYYKIVSKTEISGIYAIQSALSGSPVSACFYVYDDFSEFFAQHPTGVYHHNGTDPPIGGHAIVIVGFNDSQQYWLCKNSWGIAWADSGYFRIGYGECGIETWECCKAFVNSACFAGYVPQFYSSIQTPIDNAIVGENIYVGSGTYTENIYMKPNVAVVGSGINSTTINGKVNFTSDDNANLSNVTVNNKITVNYSDVVSLSYVKAGNTNCYIDVSNSNIVSFHNLTSHVSRLQAIYGHNNSDITIYQGSIKNKFDGIYISDSNADLLNTWLYQNYYDISAVFSTAFAFHCCFSSPVPGSTIYSYNSTVNWDRWRCCGGGFAKQVGTQSFDSGLDDDPAYKAYTEAMDNYKITKEKIREDQQSGKGFIPQNYGPELESIIDQFRRFVIKYPASPYTIPALSRIAAVWRILGRFDKLTAYMEEIANNPALQHLRSYTLNTLIPMYIKMGEHIKAIELSDQIIEEFPEHELVVELLYGKGLLYKYYVDDPKKAEEMFRMVIEHYPDHPTAQSARDELEDMGQEPLVKGLATTEEPSELSAQSYPNPFNPTTSIHFTLPEQGRVVLKIYDILGREVKTLVNEERPSGRHTVLWDGKDRAGQPAASGMYFYQLRFRNKVLTRKITLVR